MVSRLLWKDIAPGRAFHAQLWRLNHPLSPHCHDFWEAFLVLESGGTHVSNQRRESLHAGALHLIRPDDIHSIAPGSSIYINIAWPAQNWEKWCAVAGFEVPDTPQISPLAAPDLEPLFRRMTQLFALDGRAQALEIARFWAEIAARFEEDAVSAPACPDWMLRAIQTFENEKGLRAGFPELLAKSHVSPGHLAREWQRIFDQTPTHWINERRLQTAAQLLLQTSLSIKEVAARCGFDTLHYFYRVFGRHFGVTPKTYRSKRAAPLKRNSTSDLS